jgi:hypothetical protein
VFEASYVERFLGPSLLPGRVVVVVVVVMDNLSPRTRRVGSGRVRELI